MNRDDLKPILSGAKKLTRSNAIAMAEALFAALDECEVEADKGMPETWKLGVRTKARTIAGRIEEIPLP